MNVAIPATVSVRTFVPADLNRKRRSRNPDTVAFNARDRLRFAPIFPDQSARLADGLGIGPEALLARLEPGPEPVV